MLGTAVSKSGIGQKVIANSKYINADNMVKFFDFNVEYAGQVANTTFKKLYNEQEINMKDIALDEALKHSWKAMDKVAMADINKYFKGKAEIIKNSDAVDKAKDLFINKSLQKASQYGAKSSIFFGQMGVDATMNEINTSYQNNEDMSLSDIYDAMSSKYDGVKLLKYVGKDDFKDIVKKQVSKLSLHPSK